MKQSLRQYGVLRPVYRWRGKIIDGRKTARAARELGLQIPVQIDFETEEEARHYLASVHPERALKRWPCQTASEASEKFNLPLKMVAKYFHEAPKPDRRPPRRRTGALTRGKAGGARCIHFYLSEAISTSLRVNAEALGVSQSDYVRAALSAVSPELVRAKLISMSIASTVRPRR